MAPTRARATFAPGCSTSISGGPIRTTATLSLVVLLVLHACGDPTVPRIGPPPPVLVGEWSVVRPAPIVQIHLHLLPTGKVLSWGRKDDPQVWDPATGVFTAVPAPSLL